MDDMEQIEREHRWLCHLDGSPCDGGATCFVLAESESRLARLDSAELDGAHPLVLEKLRRLVPVYVR